MNNILAFVVPCYNEEAMLPITVQKLTDVITKLSQQDLVSDQSFIMLVNDGSKDASWQVIKRYCKERNNVCGVNLAGNVGHQNALMAGLMAVKDRCDICISIDADIQDDVNAIPEMIKRYNDGNDVVYGIKVQRKADSLLKRSSAQLFYKLQHMMGVKCIYNHADFRLMSNRALTCLSLYPERNLYLRGIIPSMGLKSSSVDDIISPRMVGTSKYTLKKMLNLAFDGITSFSIVPMHFVLLLGLTFIFIAFLIFLYVLYVYFTGQVVPGWSSMMLSLWFCSGCVLLGLGIVGEYIGKIYIEVKDRPRYCIDEILFNSSERDG